MMWLLWGEDYKLLKCFMALVEQTNKMGIEINGKKKDKICDRIT